MTRLLAVIVLMSVAAPRTPAGAHHPQGTTFKSGPDHDYGEMVDYPLVFPLEGNPAFGNDFSAWRAPNNTHHAIDIRVPRGTPVYAAASGTILRMNGTRNPANLPGNCCTIVILHDDGWQSWYWHLNNDSLDAPLCPGDGQGWGIADGLVPGSRVEAGQLIGWAGSSGNATCSYPHLHFELHDPHGVIVNPYQSLKNPVYPEYCTGGDAGCSRIAGPNRFATATAVSAAHHSEPSAVERVYVASGLNFPDALAATAVAARADAPILLVEPTSVPGTVGTELQRLAPERIYLLGGPATISGSVADHLGLPAHGSPTVTRIWGDDRYLTSVAISTHAFNGTGADVVVVASGEGFADALPAGTLAARLGAPVLLTRGTALPPAVRAEIERLDPDLIYLVGGPATISNGVLDQLKTIAPAQRIAGSNRYLTAIAASRVGFPDAGSADRVYVTTGMNFPDGLTGGAAAGMLDAPILLVTTNTLPLEVRQEILRLSPSEIVILGGPKSVSPSVELALKALLDID